MWVSKRWVFKRWISKKLVSMRWVFKRWVFRILPENKISFSPQRDIFLSATVQFRLPSGHKSATARLTVVFRVNFYKPDPLIQGA